MYCFPVLKRERASESPAGSHHGPGVHHPPTPVALLGPSSTHTPLPPALPPVSLPTTAAVDLRSGLRSKRASRWRWGPLPDAHGLMERRRSSPRLDPSAPGHLASPPSSVVGATSVSPPPIRRRITPTSRRPPLLLLGRASRSPNRAGGRVAGGATITVGADLDLGTSWPLQGAPTPTLSRTWMSAPRIVVLHLRTPPVPAGLRMLMASTRFAVGAAGDAARRPSWRAPSPQPW